MLALMILVCTTVIAMGFAIWTGLVGLGFLIEYIWVFACAALIALGVWAVVKFFKKR